MNSSPLIRLLAVAGVASVVMLTGCATSKKPAPVVDRSPAVAANGATSAPAAPIVVPKGHYLVKKGDTLYSIALDHGHDYKDVAAWNALENPNRILVDQVLRVTPPEEAVATADAGLGSEVAVAKPIVIESVVETRSLEGNSDRLKREPKAGKEPYSDEALARAQQPVEAIASIEIKPAPKPEVKPEPVVAKPAVPAATDVNGDPAWTWPAAGKVIATFNDSSSKGVDISGKAGDPVLAAADGKVVYSGTGLRGYGQLVIVKHSTAYLTAYAHNSKILVKEGQTVTRGQKIAEMGSSDADQVKLHFEVRKQGKPVDPLKHLPSR